MTDLFPGADRFLPVLRGLRNADRFAVGRRLLTVVALGVLADKAPPGAHRRIRAILHAETLDEVRALLMNMAETVEASEPRLTRVFTQVLVNDAIHSRSLEETLSGALAVLTEWGPGPDLQTFGRWFDAALGETSSGGPSIGDIATSRHVSDLMVGLADLGAGQSLYDPCSGLGGLLSLAAHEVDGLTLSGRDIHPISWAFSILRLHLLGLEADIGLGDSLDARPGQFDRILCDPPSSLYPDRRQTVLGKPSASTGSRRYDGLFVDHCATSLRLGGRGVVLVNQGFLARRGFDEHIRQSLLRQGLIEGIIALPSGFSPWSSAELAVLVLCDGPQSEAGVRMLDASRLPEWNKGGRLRDLRDIVTMLLQAYRSSRTEIFAKTVEARTVSESGQFRPGQYFVEQIERRSVSDLLAEADVFEARAQQESAEIARLLSGLDLRSD